jgi:phytoene dehydrogenase-like protein
MKTTDFDAIVVGSGPNGLAAAITMQQQGLSTLLIEKANHIGGGLRTEQLTLPGFKHDICSAIHPMAMISGFINNLPLYQHGLKFKHPLIPLAHPFDNGHVALLQSSINDTARGLGDDEKQYLKIFNEIISQWPYIADDMLGPLSFPKHPLKSGRFAFLAMHSALSFSKKFKTDHAKALWAGIAAHSVQPLSKLSTSAVGLVLTAAAHLKGWPVPVGGSQSIADALVSYYISLGGKIQTNFYVTSLRELPSAHALLFDVNPQQLLKIAGHSFSSIYKKQLTRFRHGSGVFKIDWALDDAIPFKAIKTRSAGTVHLGNTIQEIVAYEKSVYHGRIEKNPFVLMAQQSIVDETRAPLGKHTAWAYCHVPSHSKVDMTNAIEDQIERFALGFKDRILAKHTFNTEQLEEYNPNYIGGDITGGVMDIFQLFTRPALRLSPYRTSKKGIYICSASTPPGGGVHGLCGYNAAKKALLDIFKIR